MLNTEGYLVLAVISMISFSCACILCSFCCCEGKIDKYKVKADIHVLAPIDWLWDNYPQNFDLEKIFGVDKNKRAVKEGIVATRMSDDFPRVGSEMTMKLRSGSRVTERVSIRDDSTYTYQTIRDTCFKRTISTMVFTKVSPSKS